MSVILDKHDFVEGPMAAADVAEYSVYILNTKARYKRKNLLPDQTQTVQGATAVRTCSPTQLQTKPFRRDKEVKSRFITLYLSKGISEETLDNTVKYKVQP